MNAVRAVLTFLLLSQVISLWVLDFSKARSCSWFLWTDSLDTVSMLGTCPTQEPQDYISALSRDMALSLALLASLVDDIQRALTKFAAEYEAIRMRTSKSEAMILLENGGNLALGGEVVVRGYSVKPGSWGLARK